MLTLVGRPSGTFASIDDVMSALRPYLELGSPGAIRVYGPEKAFHELHARVREAVIAVAEEERAIASRWMAEATSWEDYFQSKDMRVEVSTRHDRRAAWLVYGGLVPPVTSSRP